MFTGDNVAVLSTIAFHTAYLIGAVFVSAFINTPPLCRLFVLIAVPSNACAVVCYQAGLSFTNLTLLIALSLMGHWSVYAFKGRRFENTQRLKITTSLKQLALREHSVAVPDR